MAVNLNPPLKQKLNPFLSPPYFRRKEEDVKSNRIKRKVKLRPKHIIISFLLISGLFLLIQQAYLFLITWEKLKADQVGIKCPKPELEKTIQNYFMEKNLGNLLLLDIKRVQETIKSHAWVKDVHIKKKFPSTLSIEVVPRVPLAVIKTEQYYLIDRDGILIQSIDPSETKGLPVIIEDNDFESGFMDKFELAVKCLDDLSPEQKKGVEKIDLSKHKCVSIKLDQISPWLILGDSRFSERIQDYTDKRSYFAKFGELESINIRYEGRYILTPSKKGFDSQLYTTGKEES